MTTARRQMEEGASQTIDPLERRLTQALESVPLVAISDDFSARVMAHIPVRRTLRYEIPAHASIGRRVAFAAIALLFVAMFVFALQTGTMNPAIRDAAIWAVAAEFIILTVWMSLRPNHTR